MKAMIRLLTPFFIALLLAASGEKIRIAVAELRCVAPPSAGMTDPAKMTATLEDRLASGAFSVRGRNEIPDYIHDLERVELGLTARATLRDPS